MTSSRRSRPRSTRRWDRPRSESLLSVATNEARARGGARAWHPPARNATALALWRPVDASRRGPEAMTFFEPRRRPSEKGCSSSSVPCWCSRPRAAIPSRAGGLHREADHGPASDGAIEAFVASAHRGQQKLPLATALPGMERAGAATHHARSRASSRCTIDRRTQETRGPRVGAELGEIAESPQTKGSASCERSRPTRASSGSAFSVTTSSVEAQAPPAIRGSSWPTGTRSRRPTLATPMRVSGCCVVPVGVG